MPSAGVGLPVVVRWRMGSDTTVASSGWRIDDVTIGSPPACGGSAPTLNSAGAVSRKAHNTSPTPTDYDVPLPLVPFTGAVGIEPRSGPVAGAHTIVVNFTNPVSVSSTAVTTGTGSATASVAGNVVTVNLTGVTDVQRMAVTLMGVSDGANLGNVQVPMGLLQGDVNGSGGVNTTDISQTKSAASLGTVNSGNFRSDVNVGGTINTTDVGIVKSRAGTQLP